MTGTADVTVVVVVKDRLELMTRCLEALKSQEGVSYEVVVVDNISTDGTYELVQSSAAESPRRFVVLRDDGPVARLRNLALTAARTPWVAFTDSDCVPSPGWLAGLVAAAADGVGVVQGQVIPDPAVPLERWHLSLEVSSFTRLYETANLMVRRGPLLELGGFDEGLGLYGEDTAAGWRLARAGWRGVFTADAVVAHAVTHPGMRRVLRRVWQTYRNWPGLIRLFPEMRQELMWRPLFLRRTDVAIVLLALTPLTVTFASWAGLIAAVPWLWANRRRSGRWARPIDLVDALAFDAVKLTGLLVGSVEQRTVVL